MLKNCKLCMGDFYQLKGLNIHLTGSFTPWWSLPLTLYAVLGKRDTQENNQVCSDFFFFCVFWSYCVVRKAAAQASYLLNNGREITMKRPISLWTWITPHMSNAYSGAGRRQARMGLTTRKECICFPLSTSLCPAHAFSKHSPLTLTFTDNRATKQTLIHQCVYLHKNNHNIWLIRSKNCGNAAVLLSTTCFKHVVMKCIIMYWPMYIKFKIT